MARFSVTDSANAASTWLVGIAGVLFLCAQTVPCVPAAEIDDQLARANSLRLTGHYEEAEELFAQLAGEHAAAAALGQADCLRARGEFSQALKVLNATAEANPSSTALLAQQAQYAFDAGDYDNAETLAQKALEVEADNLLARWIIAQLQEANGKLEDAEKSYEWFVDFYNRAPQIESPDDLLVVGQAAAQYARWKRNGNQFRFLIGELHPEALRLDENFWPAHLAGAALYLEKFNQPAAAKELDAALAINPNASDIHAARAELAMQNLDLTAAQASIDRALELNPRSIAAQQLQADVHMANFQLAEAIAVLEKTLAWNARDEATLGRLAAACGALDGLPANLDDAPADSRLGKLIAQSVERNPHCGRFFETLGDAFDLLRRYPAAAHYYREAERRMPQLIGVRGKLGLVAMRLGDEVEAAQALQQSFADDPFHVRVKNMLEVLDVLSGYAVLETEHFVIKFDRGQDQILAEAAAKYLEEAVFPAVVEKMGYAPPEKTLFEIFNRARNTNGHGWFSARMVGLPYVGTVGACAGKMVAFVSPDATPQKFNWGRVLKHEFIHVVNLQQTNFNVPHWFTEALAVWNEEQPRPAEWTKLVARRAAANTLFDLDDINFGFVRPADQDDWTLAYCQAELYAEFMLAEYGDEALSKMLAAYGDNLSTRDALQRCFQVDQVDFEREYRNYLDQIVASAGPQPDPAPLDLAQLQTAAAKDPQNSKALAHLAAAHLQRKNMPQARKWALAARAVDPQQPLAAYVLARVLLSIGDSRQALEVLEGALSEADPHEQTLLLLAALKMQAKDYDAAERLYLLGLEKFFDDEPWLKALARLYLQTQNSGKTYETLVRLADLDGDDVLIPKKLALESLARNDFAAAEKWANRALAIDVMDAELHAALGQAAVAQGNLKQGIAAYDFAIRIQPEQLTWRLRQAETQVEGGQLAEARKSLDALLRLAPDHPGASALQEKLPPP